MVSGVSSIYPSSSIVLYAVSGSGFSVTLDTYAHLYPGKGKEMALGLHNVNSNGLTSGQGTMEAQLLSLMTEIKQSLPATISEYENDDIIVWDCRNKRKNIISFQDLPTMYKIMVQENRLEFMHRQG